MFPHGIGANRQGIVSTRTGARVMKKAWSGVPMFPLYTNQQRGSHGSCALGSAGHFERNWRYEWLQLRDKDNTIRNTSLNSEQCTAEHIMKLGMWSDLSSMARCTRQTSAV